MKYERPRLEKIEIIDRVAEGGCSSGSNASGVCVPGNKATNSCGPGTAAQFCNAGTAR